MKIAFYSPSWPAAQAQNGIATYVDIMTRALTKAGHECVIITPHIRGDAEDNVYLAQGRTRNESRYFFTRVSDRLTGEGKTLHTIMADNINDALELASKDSPVDFFEIEESFGWAFRVQRLAKYPVFIRTHGPHFLVHQGEIKKSDKARIQSEGEALSNCFTYSCPSEGLLREVKSKYELTNPKASVVPNPVEFAAEEDSWRLDECDQNMILFVGRFDLVKGADLMLSAFSNLVEKFPNARLVMAGKDTGLPDENGAVLHFDEYAKKHLSESLRSRIEYLGPVKQGRLSDLRKQALMCVCASRFECFPYAVTEALALGCPVVSTRTYGPPEFLNENCDLLLADTGDVEQLTDHISSLLDNPQKAAALAAAGKKAAFMRLSPDIVIERYIEFCRESLNSGITETSSTEKDV